MITNLRKTISIFLKKGEKSMGKNKEDVVDEINKIKHPAIDLTLKELGILKEITFKEDTFFITLSFPFANIPIKDQLIESVCKPVKEMDFKCSVGTMIMNEQEKQDFLRKERSAWTGL